jgi:hypothetical protein
MHLPLRLPASLVEAFEKGCLGGVAGEDVHWKIHVARTLRRTVAAPHRWIAEQLNMGTPAAVRVNVARFS